MRIFKTILISIFCSLAITACSAGAEIQDGSYHRLNASTFEKKNGMLIGISIESLETDRKVSLVNQWGKYSYTAKLDNQKDLVIATGGSDTYLISPIGNNKIKLTLIDSPSTTYEFALNERD